MGHSHSHAHNHSHDHAGKNLRVAFFLNLIFALIELVGGLYTNSIAIITDAVHDFGDSLSLAISWFLQKKSEKKSDEKYSYGYRRYSLLGAIVISVVLLVSAVFIIRESVARLLYPEATDASGMLLLAILGILVNGAAVLRLKKGTSLNERAVFLHLMEDVLGWIAVLIVSIVMLFVELPILDPLLSIGITIWVLTNVYRNLRDVFKVLLQGVPQEVNVDGLKQAILQIPQVESFHDFHLWSLDGERNIMSLHVVLRNETKAAFTHEVKAQIRVIASSFNVAHTTIETESEAEMPDCDYRDGCE